MCVSHVSDSHGTDCQGWNLSFKKGLRPRRAAGGAQYDGLGHEAMDQLLPQFRTHDTVVHGLYARNVQPAQIMQNGQTVEQLIHEFIEGTQTNWNVESMTVIGY